MTLSTIFPNNLRKIVCASVALLCLFAAARAQTQDEPVVTVDTNLVLLNVGVADHKGQAVTALPQGDFVAYEDGHKQSLVHFRPASAPSRLLLLPHIAGP